MISDQEKKAIEWLKKADWFSARLYAPTILYLIEKQSKEIEELKTEKAKRSWVHIKENGEVEPLFYVSEDKIKAKVIEIKNRPVKDEFITATQGKLNTIIEIESLLEKE